MGSLPSGVVSHSGPGWQLCLEHQQEAITISILILLDVIASKEDPL